MRVPYDPRPYGIHARVKFANDGGGIEAGRWRGVNLGEVDVDVDFDNTQPGFLNICTIRVSEKKIIEVDV
jgi:hypothetical protein